MKSQVVSPRPVVKTRIEAYGAYRNHPMKPLIDHYKFRMLLLAILCLAALGGAAESFEPELILTHPAVEAPIGEAFWLPIEISGLTNPVGTLVLILDLNPEHVEMLEIEIAPGLAVLGKQTHYRIQETQLHFVCTWGDPVTAPLELFRIRLTPLEAAGETLDWLESYTLSAASPEALRLSGEFQARPVQLRPANQIFHSADSNRDQRIGLGELLRVVQLYQAGAYHCDPTSEDGYAPGRAAHAPEGCTRHDSDFLESSWQIGLPELLHLIQLYNAPGYAPAPEHTERFRPALP